MGFETPKNLAGESEGDELKKNIIKAVSGVMAAGTMFVASEVGAEGTAKDKTVIGQEEYAIAGVIKPGIDGAIKPGIDGALRKDNKITTTKEAELSDNEHARNEYVKLVAGEKFEVGGKKYIIPKTNLR